MNLNRFIKNLSIFALIATVFSYIIGAFFGGFNVGNWVVFGKVVLMIVWVILCIVSVVLGLFLEKYLEEQDEKKVKGWYEKAKEMADDCDRLAFNRELMEKDIKELEAIRDHLQSEIDRAK